tara:strand:+ start:217 stop:1218 length:1002 start_codon:yes stop_codon:yes gene_type:complete
MKKAQQIKFQLKQRLAKIKRQRSDNIAKEKAAEAAKLERLKVRPMDPLPRKALEKQIKATTKRNIKKIKDKPSTKRREKRLKDTAEKKLNLIKQKASKENAKAKKKIIDKWNKKIREYEKQGKRGQWKVRRAKKAKQRALDKQGSRYAYVQKTTTAKLPPLDYLQSSKVYTPQPRQLINNETDIYREEVGSVYIATFKYWIHVPPLTDNQEMILVDWVRLVSDSFLNVDEWHNKFRQWVTQAKAEWQFNISSSQMSTMQKLQASLFPNVPLLQAGKEDDKQRFLNSPYGQMFDGRAAARHAYIFLVLNLVTRSDITLFHYDFVALGEVLATFK